MIIQHNLPAMNANRQLGMNNTRTAKNLEKLSSGYKVNRAGDDAAGLAISEKMRGQIRGLSMAAQNAQHGINLIQTAEGGLNEICDILHRIRELSVQAANGTYVAEDRGAIDLELGQMVDEITAIAQKTHFNNIPLLSPQIITYPKAAPYVVGTRPGVTINPTDTPIVDVGKTIENKSDIIFAVDISGSMYGTINNVKAHINEFMSNLPADSRVALLFFSDELTMGEPTIFEDFTTDSGEIEKILEELKMYGGGDWEESGLETLEEAIGHFSGTAADTEKHIVFITDADVHAADTTGKSLLTVEQVNQDLRDANITLHALAPKFGEPFDHISGIADGTGSDYYDIEKTWEYDYVADIDNPYIERVEVTVPLEDIVLQIGANGSADQRLKIELSDMRSVALGLSLPNGQRTVKIDTVKNASASIRIVDQALIKVLDKRAYFGAQQNRLEHTLKNLGVTRENLQNAESLIRDVDMAKEMMEFTKNNILIQASQSMLAQANQLPQGVLQLLR